ncbi:phage structural protein [Priestia flexa]|uniref:phage structural protein n=1 Tax=Priestia flexa TaxID=86664 RepID=UPI003F86ED53
MVRTYDADRASAIVNGVYITGFAEGSMMKAEPDEDYFSTKVSAKGEVIISESHNKLGTVTITVSQTSPSLPMLMRLANSKKPFPVWIMYNDGTFKERAGGTQARIVKKPGKEYAAEAGSREFQFKVFDYMEE